MNDNKNEIKEKIKEDTEEKIETESNIKKQDIIDNIEESSAPNNNDVYQHHENDEYSKLYHNSYLYNSWINTAFISSIRKFCYKIPGVYSL